MAQVNGTHALQTPLNATKAALPGRVISTSMMRQATLEQTPSPDSTQWSSAIGHASTGKSGRVIERLQQEIDRHNRDKQLSKLRLEEAERAVENLNTRCQYLEDRNSNFESTHEANLRQLQRKERQVEDLREELRKEKQRTTKAEAAAQTAALNEDVWREQANEAKATAQQKETEYDTIVACRNMDNDRHQGGLNRIKNNIANMMKQREDDLQKQKRMEIIAEQQKQTIEQLEELTKRLSANFRAYRAEIDSAIDGLKNTASTNDILVHEKVEEMNKVTGDMRWVMNMETIVNGRQVPPRPQANHQQQQTSQSRDEQSEEQSYTTAQTRPSSRPDTSAPPSPSKKMSLDFRRHRRKDSKKKA
ncbi:mother-specific HO expression [Elasticomyces elasticus]|nr:mother-specific HO expression [Elasticomyces elasticus]